MYCSLLCIKNVKKKVLFKKRRNLRKTQEQKNKIPRMRHLSDSNRQGEDGEVIWLLGKYLCGEKNPFRRGFFHSLREGSVWFRVRKITSQNKLLRKAACSLFHPSFKSSLDLSLSLSQRRIFTGHQLLESISGRVEWNLITCVIGVLSKMIPSALKSPHPKDEEEQSPTQNRMGAAPGSK